MNLSDIAILNIKVFNYQWIISGISKNETINLKKHIHFTEKKRNIIRHKNLFSHIKIGNKNSTFGDIKIEKNKFYRSQSPIF